MEGTADIALIGLAVMGQNLILNMNDHGYTVVAYNRTVSKVDEFLNDAAKGHKTVIGAHSIEEMVGLLKRPRKIMLMVKAGKAVDDFIERCCPTSKTGDLIIDGGNSHFPTPSAAQSTWRARACCSSAPAFRAAKRARVTARP